MASVGENVAMSITCASRPVRLSPQPSASTAVNSGSSVAHSEPNAIASTTAAAMKPMNSLGPPPGCCVACWMPAAAELHVEAVAARVLGGGDQLVVGGLRHVRDRLLAVHVHVGERDRLVLGDLPRGRALRERAVDPFDVRALGDRLERLLDPRLDGRVGDIVGREHDLIGVGRLGVEVVGEEVQRRRGLRARQRERVRVARARAGVEPAEREQRDDPDGEDDELVAETPAREGPHRRNTIGGDVLMARKPTSRAVRGTRCSGGSAAAAGSRRGAGAGSGA